MKKSGSGIRLNFATLKEWRDARMCLDLFADSEGYHEQMDPIPSSKGSLDRALSNAHT